jgi:hypothetical protein
MRIEIGDWVRVPSLKFEGPHCAAQVAEIEGFRNGCERIVLRKSNGKTFSSYPIMNVDKITEAEALLLLFER